MALVFLLGGARSGKSTLAVQLAGRSGAPVCFIATAEAGDQEMAARIARHRDERPTDWTTVEEPIDLVGAFRAVPDGTCAVVDCLSLWVSNLMGAGWEHSRIEAVARDAAGMAAARPGLTVAVSNEVGFGIVPDNALAREYRDVLGRVNAAWADAAERTALVVAGRVLSLSWAQPFVDSFGVE
jgi:adenosylcobinamide kinase / adenosylcobinamide-phosphate guanylyltransferase